MGMRWTMRCMRECLKTSRSQIVVTMLSYRAVIKLLKPLNHWYLAALQHRSGRVRLPSSAPVGTGGPSPVFSFRASRPLHAEFWVLRAQFPNERVEFYGERVEWVPEDGVILRRRERQVPWHHADFRGWRRPSLCGLQKVGPHVCPQTPHVSFGTPHVHPGDSHDGPLPRVAARCRRQCTWPWGIAHVTCAKIHSVR